MAKQYGLEDVRIERFKLSAKTWDGELGELWLLDPRRKRLLISYRDVPASLASGSRTGEATAELVYVGRGNDKKDYADRNVSGKIVLASGPPGAAHNLAVREFGAAGVVSFANPTGKPIDRPDQVAWNALGRGFGPDAANQKTTFGFNISHRLGMELVDLLERRQTLTVLAKVRATEYEADMQAPTAVIKGTGASQQEVVVAGHLFEGIAKQGAMDDASGWAARGGNSSTTACWGARVAPCASRGCPRSRARAPTWTAFRRRPNAWSRRFRWTWWARTSPRTATACT
jgi:hypothetical protein